MKKNIMFKLGVILMSVVVLLLFLLVTAKMPNAQNNGFNRKWLSNTIFPLHEMKTDLPLVEICGATNFNIFLASQDPRWLLIVDWSFNIRDTILFYVPLTETLQTTHKLIADSPWIYLHANNMPGVLYGEINSKIVDTTRFATPLYTRSTQIAPNQIVLRGFDSTHEKQVFKKIEVRTGRVINHATIVEHQIDPGFSTDGVIQFDDFSNKIIYVQYYQNRFFCLDTSLSIIYSRNTIDTTRNNVVQMKQVEEKGVTKILSSAPRQIVNRFSCASNGNLFIISGLKADNETTRDFNTKTALDVYKIDNGEYIGSLYIPNIKAKDVLSILVHNNLLIVVHTGYVSTFKLNNIS